MYGWVVWFEMFALEVFPAIAAAVAEGMVRTLAKLPPMAAAYPLFLRACSDAALFSLV
jgi:hypothetical protein